jgi:RNA polymerase sigma-70 factor (ECF subfamily)
VGPTADERLLRAMYTEHGGPLLGYVLRLTGGDRQHAEDIVQETLLRAWRHPEALTGRPVRPWLFTVARNLVVDAHRAKLARGGPHVPIEATEESQAASLPGSDDIDRALESWTVAEALADLSPQHRAVLIETYYRGHSVAEAATALGVPPGTVKSRTYYALRALKLALEERGLAP